MDDFDAVTVPGRSSGVAVVSYNHVSKRHDSVNLINVGVLARESVHLNDHAAQRLWVLERGGAAARPAGEQVCRFVGAVAVLDDGAVYVVFVMSPEPQRASELVLQTGDVRVNITRDGIKFASLDEAIAWTTAKRACWIEQGWMDATPDSNDR